MNKQKFTKEEVSRIAKLANIELSNSEVEKYTKQLSAILEYFEKISKLNFSEKSSTSNPLLTNVFRKDEASKSLFVADATLNRKETSDGGYIRIKGVLNK